MFCDDRNGLELLSTGCVYIVDIGEMRISMGGHECILGYGI